MLELAQILGVGRKRRKMGVHVLGCVHIENIYLYEWQPLIVFEASGPNFTGIVYEW